MKSAPIYSNLGNPNRMALDRLLPLSFPISLYIEVTNICNFRCKFCPESFDDYEHSVGGLKNMNMEIFNRLYK